MQSMYSYNFVIEFDKSTGFDFSSAFADSDIAFFYFLSAIGMKVFMVFFVIAVYSAVCQLFAFFDRTVTGINVFCIIKFL